MAVKLSQPVPGVAKIVCAPVYQGRRDQRKLCQGWHAMVAGLVGVCWDVRSLNDQDLCALLKVTCGLTFAPGLERVALLGDRERLSRVLMVEKVGFDAKVMRCFDSDQSQDAWKYAEGQEDTAVK